MNDLDRKKEPSVVGEKEAEDPEPRDDVKEAGKEDNTASKHEKMIGTKGNIVKDDEQVLVRKPSIVRKTGDNESNEVSDMISKEQKQEEPSQEGEKAKETMKKEATVVQK